MERTKIIEGLERLLRDSATPPYCLATGGASDDRLVAAHQQQRDVLQAALALLRVPEWSEWSAAWEHLATELKTPQAQARFRVHLTLFQALYALAHEKQLHEVVRGTVPAVDENEALRAIKLGLELRNQLLTAKLTALRPLIAQIRRDRERFPATTGNETVRWMLAKVADALDACLNGEPRLDDETGPTTP